MKLTRQVCNVALTVLMCIVVANSMISSVSALPITVTAEKSTTAVSSTKIMQPVVGTVVIEEESPTVLNHIYLIDLMHPEIVGSSNLRSGNWESFASSRTAMDTTNAVVAKINHAALATQNEIDAWNLAFEKKLGFKAD